MTPSRDVEKMLELLTEMSQDGILIAGEDGRVTRANARMAEITGRAQAELVGLDVGELLPGEWRDLDAAELRALASTMRSPASPNLSVPRLRRKRSR